jgi:hypothetical protein
MISSSGAYGYDREANYYYFPVGIELSSSFDGSSRNLVEEWNKRVN